jgi:acyl carrier protein phosphodiesterase
LAKNWRHYANNSFDSFVNDFHERSLKIYKQYPRQPQVFLSRLISSGYLTQFASLQGLEESLRRIDLRLSQRVTERETASEYLPVIREKLGSIEEDFFYFMPELINHFKSTSGLSLHDHWIK